MELLVWLIYTVLRLLIFYYIGFKSKDYAPLPIANGLFWIILLITALINSSYLPIPFGEMVYRVQASD